MAAVVRAMTAAIALGAGLLHAIQTDLFAVDAHRKKIDSLGDPLVEVVVELPTAPK